MRQSLQQIQHLLQCVDCSAGDLIVNDRSLICPSCHRQYELIEDRVLAMMPSKPRPNPQVYEDYDYQRYRDLYDKHPERMYYSEQSGTMARIRSSQYRNTLRFLKEKTTKPNDYMLDVGCGTGAFLPYIRETENVIGIDTNIGPLLVAKQKHPTAFFIQADATMMPFRSNIFHHVFSHSNLEHLWYLTEGLAEISRVLHSAGAFYVGLPTEGGLAWSLGRKISTERVYKRKYNIPYDKIAKIEHCNTAKKVMTYAKQLFISERTRYWPCWLPIMSLNLTVSIRLTKRPM